MTGSSPIRLAEDGDLGLLLDFLTEFYAESGDPLEREQAGEALRRLHENEELGRLWVVEVAGVAAGYAAVTFGFSLEYLGRDAFLDELFLLPRFRGEGLGSRVMTALKEECRRLGVRALHLEVERSNERGQALYRGQGFSGNDRRLLTRRLSGETVAPEPSAAMRRFLVVETFRPGCRERVRSRFRRHGRLLPEGLDFVQSWLERDGDRCFQLMETVRPELFDDWTARWNDLVDFEVIELDGRWEND